MKKVIGIIVMCFLGLFGIIALANSFYTVKSGERGIVFTFGKIDAVVAEGPHFKVPFIQSLEKVDVRTLKAKAPCDAGTKDLQMVSSEVAINYHLDPNKLKELYMKSGLDVETKLIDPRIQEVVKAITAKYSAEQLMSQRESVKTSIVNNLTTELGKYYVIIEDVQITNFRFSDKFNAAIEAKQTAEQQALTAENDLRRIEVEARQKIAMAEAEAKTIQIQANAIKAQGGAEYVMLKFCDKWNGVLPQTALGNGGITSMFTINK
jgi:regulator of protease activity HflC (stomatin/prohibitin superfamily)